MMNVVMMMVVMVMMMMMIDDDGDDDDDDDDWWWWSCIIYIVIVPFPTITSERPLTWITHSITKQYSNSATLWWSVNLW